VVTAAASGIHLRVDGDCWLDSARPAATNRGRRPGPVTIAALQRSAGNAAVTALLSAPAVQRAIGDGHDLASPRFAGVPILEPATTTRRGSGRATAATP